MWMQADAALRCKSKHSGGPPCGSVAARSFDVTALAPRTCLVVSLGVAGEVLVGLLNPAMTASLRPAMVSANSLGTGSSYLVVNHSKSLPEKIFFAGGWRAGGSFPSRWDCPPLHSRREQVTRTTGIDQPERGRARGASLQPGGAHRGASWRKPRVPASRTGCSG
jgi:hypothetical protein